MWRGVLRVRHTSALRRTVLGQPLRRSFCAAPKEKEKTPLIDRIPFGLIFSLSFIGLVGGWFYRGWKSGKIHDKLKEEIKSTTALAPEEVEEVRTSNNLLLAHFDALMVRVRARFPDKKADAREFFDFCGKALGGEYAASGIKAGHLIERLVLSLDKDENGLVSTEVLIAALSMVVESSVDDRIEVLFKAFARMQDQTKYPDAREKISEERMVALTDSLMKTCQLPLRVLSREYNEYPLRRYTRSSPEYVLGRALNEVIAARKKEKTLVGYELELKDEMATCQMVEAKAEKPEKPLMERPTWELKDFSDVILSRSLCAWGECYSE